MKNRYLFLLVLALLCRKVKSQEYNSWEKVKSNGEGKLSIIYFESPGLIYGPKEQPKGLCISVINDFIGYVQNKYKKNISLEVVNNEKEFAVFLKQVQNTPNLIGVSAITITEERKAIFKFTPAYLACPVVLITNKSVGAIADFKDLKNYTPVALNGSSQTDMINLVQKKYMPGSKINFLTNPKEVIDNVSSSPTAFTILGLNDFLDASRRNQNVKIQKIKLGLEMFGFIMSKGSDWDIIWNEFLTEKYLQSSDYKKSIAKNVGSVFLNAMNSQ